MNQPSKAMLFGTGIVMLVIGIVFFAMPGFTMSFFTVLAGIGFLVGGLSSLGTWWSMRNVGGSPGALVLGVLAVVLALVCFAHPLALAASLTWIVALCIVVTGIAQLIALVVGGTFPGRTAAIISTAIMTLFGIFALVWPPMVVQFVGISLIIEGVTTISLGIFYK